MLLRKSKRQSKTDLRRSTSTNTKKINRQPIITYQNYCDNLFRLMIWAILPIQLITIGREAHSMLWMKIVLLSLVLTGCDKSSETEGSANAATNTEAVYVYYHGFLKWKRN
jgi:hypothetical protein